jgi:aspartyl-tRNA(Asn)/glutamyl-tRNA(Gln) amidotransferase subunit C
MSKITQADIQHIAELAKIHLQEGETETLTGKLSDILNLVEQMQSVDTNNINPMAHAIYQNQKLREDKANDDDKRDDYQKLSKHTQNGFYLVPKVIE